MARGCISTKKVENRTIPVLFLDFPRDISALKINSLVTEKAKLSKLMTATNIDISKG